MNADAVLRELDGLRALARSLVHGDADADDLVQDTAVAAIAHPPDEDRPIRPWLATVLRNRWRMDRRGRSRRLAREELAVPATPGAPDELLGRARLVEKLAAALVALDEPYRTVVMRRYLDGQSAAEIARALGVPAGTVRWRLKTGLDRLRAALADESPAWQRALLPFTAVKGAVLVKAKTTTISLVLLVLLLGVGSALFVFLKKDDASPTNAPSVAGSRAGSAMSALAPRTTATGDAAVAMPEPLPGQGRAFVEAVAAAGGTISGRVINWSTGDGVANAELTFSGGTGASTVRTDKHGSFELAPAVAGAFSLTTVVAQGFLPYAPELAHSGVRIETTPRQAVRGLTLFLFPAIDYQGRVVDGGGSPVAGARVKAASPGGEQALEKVTTEWVTDAKGSFTFNAPDFTVFEATRGTRRGWAVLDTNVATTHQLVITLGDAPARDLTIRGKTVDASGALLPDVLISATPTGAPGKQELRAPAFATSGTDGTFTLEGLDRGDYALIAELDDHAPLVRERVAGGTQNLVLALDPGQPLSGTVVTSDDEPVPAYTLLVTRRKGLTRDVIVARSVIDPRGRFSVRVPKGDYEVLASAYGWAPSSPVPVSAGTTDARITVTAGATLRGVVRDVATGAPLEYARVSREGAGGGASAAPANAGTVTRADGTFELTGIPPGPLTYSVGAGGYHPRIEAGLVASDGAVLGPVELALKKLAEGEQPKIELVGIGVKLAGDGDTMRVDLVVPESGAAAAGIAPGDRITAIDGVAVTTLGMDGAVARIRGVAHTRVNVTFLRGEQTMTLAVERKPLRF